MKMPVLFPAQIIHKLRSLLGSWDFSACNSELRLFWQFKWINLSYILREFSNGVTLPTEHYILFCSSEEITHTWCGIKGYWIVALLQCIYICFWRPFQNISWVLFSYFSVCSVHVSNAFFIFTPCYECMFLDTYSVLSYTSLPV